MISSPRARGGCQTDQVRASSAGRRPRCRRRTSCSAGRGLVVDGDAGNDLQPGRPRALRVQHLRGGGGERAVRRRRHRRWHVRSRARPGRVLPGEALRLRPRRGRGRRAETGELPGPRAGSRAVRAPDPRAGHPEPRPVRTRHRAPRRRPARHPGPARRRRRGRAADPGELGPAVELGRAVLRARVLPRRHVPLLGRLVAPVSRDRDARRARRGDHGPDALAGRDRRRTSSRASSPRPRRRPASPRPTTSSTAPCRTTTAGCSSGATPTSRTSSRWRSCPTTPRSPGRGCGPSWPTPRTPASRTARGSTPRWPSRSRPGPGSSRSASSAASRWRSPVPAPPPTRPRVPRTRPSA